MKNEEEARIGVALFNGVKFGKSHLATCLMSEFTKMMEVKEEEENKEQADLKDLREPVLDTKRDQYLYQSGKNVFVNYFSPQSANNRSDENTVTVLENASDKPVQWSPQGTYVIVIKADKVDFLGGGGAMRPIITLKMNKCFAAIMSPCERYVLTYAPHNDTTFIVWNFKTAEAIGELEYANGEHDKTYKWSFDGNYLAKAYKEETVAADGAVKVKEGIKFMEIKPESIIAKKQSAVDIVEWCWAPSKNLLIYTTLPEVEDATRDPQITFL